MGVSSFGFGGTNTHAQLGQQACISIAPSSNGVYFKDTSQHEAPDARSERWRGSALCQFESQPKGYGSNVKDTSRLDQVAGTSQALCMPRFLPLSIVYDTRQEDATGTGPPWPKRVAFLFTGLQLPSRGSLFCASFVARCTARSRFPAARDG